MRARHPENPNLHCHYVEEFKTLPVLPGNFPMVTEYLETLHSVFERALNDYRRILVVRVDPKIPSEINARMTSEDHQRLIDRFLRSFKSIIKSDHQRRNRGGWAPHTKVRYVWCREFYQEGKPHYHFLFILNRDVYHQIGSPCSPQENLATRISRAWYSALGLEWNQNCPLIHIPDQPQYWVDRDDVHSLHRAFRRGSYLCKSESKHYGDGMRSFGASRS